MADRSRDQKRAEHEVEKEEARGGAFVVAVERTMMPMLIADPALPGTPAVFVNDAFLAMSGYQRDEVLGRSYHMLGGPDTDPRVARDIDVALRAGETAVREVRLYRKDGKHLWALQHVTPVFEDGRVRHHFASFLDITARRAAEDELRRVNEDLDRRVASRTERLEEANRRLEVEARRRIEVERVLRATLDDKDALLRDKDALIREVNHRVKNTLQMASSLLRTQEGAQESQPVRDALRGAVERLDRMAEIHTLLYRAQALQEIEFGAYLSLLCRDLLATMEDGGTRRVVLEVDGEEAFLKPDLAVPLALIVNEAVTNALKHAFPDDRHGRVDVQFRHSANGVLRLSVSDNGVGMPAERRSGSIGLMLVENLAEQIGGVATIVSESGTSVVVTVP